MLRAYCAQPSDTNLWSRLALEHARAVLPATGKTYDNNNDDNEDTHADAIPEMRLQRVLVGHQIVLSPERRPVPCAVPAKWKELPIRMVLWHQTRMLCAEAGESDNTIM